MPAWHQGQPCLDAVPVRGIGIEAVIPMARSLATG